MISQGRGANVPLPHSYLNGQPISAIQTQEGALDLAAESATIPATFPGPTLPLGCHLSTQFHLPQPQEASPLVCGNTTACSKNVFSQHSGPYSTFTAPSTRNTSIPLVLGSIGLVPC